jgi:hypothetical protein
MIVGICGKKNSGKNVVGNAIQGLSAGYTPEETEEMIERADQVNLNIDTNWQIKSFAGKVKIIAGILANVDFSMFDDREFKDSVMSGWNMTGREFLQKIGTDCMRDNLDKDVWVKALMADYTEQALDFGAGKELILTKPDWLITDMRFPNEAQAVKKYNGIVLKLLRHIDSEDAHPSEKEVEKIEADHVIDNRRLSILSTIYEVKYFMNKFDLFS